MVFIKPAYLRKQYEWTSHQLTETLIQSPFILNLQFIDQIQLTETDETQFLLAVSVRNVHVGRHLLTLL